MLKRHKFTIKLNAFCIESHKKPITVESQCNFSTDVVDWNFYAAKGCHVPLQHKNDHAPSAALEWLPNGPREVSIFEVQCNLSATAMSEVVRPVGNRDAADPKIFDNWMAVCQGEAKKKKVSVTRKVSFSMANRLGELRVIIFTYVT